MIVKSVFNNNESYSHENWIYRDVNVGFSRLYYILDGEAYYEEGGKTVRFKKGYLYLTPVKKPFTIYDDPNDKLLHTYTHVYTIPPISEFTEIEVVEGTPIFDAVMLWRKYVKTESNELLTNTVQFLLSCIDLRSEHENTVAKAAKKYIDGLDDLAFDMSSLCRSIGYTREHITRCFSAAYNMTPKQYADQKKMDTALLKLMKNEKICDVAYDAGYSSAYSFSKAFKKHFGLSPQNYIKTLK